MRRLLLLAMCAATARAGTRFDPESAVIDFGRQIRHVRKAAASEPPDTQIRFVPINRNDIDRLHDAIESSGISVFNEPDDCDVNFIIAGKRMVVADGKESLVAIRQTASGRSSLRVERFALRRQGSWTFLHCWIYDVRDGNILDLQSIHRIIPRSPFGVASNMVRVEPQTPWEVLDGWQRAVRSFLKGTAPKRT